MASAAKGGFNKGFNKGHMAGLVTGGALGMVMTALVAAAELEKKAKQLKERNNQHGR
jgi:hypothetical protein